MTQEQLALLEEILSHRRFREWATGEAPEMDHFWDAGVGDDPVRKEILSHAKEIAGSFHAEAPRLSGQYILEKVNQAISAGKSASEEKIQAVSSRRIKSRSGMFLQSAASVLIVFSLGWAAYRYMGTKDTDHEPNSASVAGKVSADRIISIKNTEKTPRHVHLSDGSSVILQPGSEIRFPESFVPEKREVRLYGEAFFEVVKNPAAPFYVLANQTATKVVGTSFRLKAKPDMPFLELNVKSGTVAVFNDKITEGYDLSRHPQDRVTLLKKNEKAIFELFGDELRKQPDVADMPARLSIENFSFLYEETPLQAVFSDLETAYGITIAYNRDELAGCSLTAELGDEPLYKKIKWICSILEADYHLDDDKITIYGRPCQ